MSWQWPASCPRRGPPVRSAKKCSAGVRMRMVPGSPRLRLAGWVLVGAEDTAFAAKSGPWKKIYLVIHANEI
jgi:hypothetical protein